MVGLTSKTNSHSGQWSSHLIFGVLSHILQEFAVLKTLFQTGALGLTTGYLQSITSLKSHPKRKDFGT